MEGSFKILTSCLQLSAIAVIGEAGGTSSPDSDLKIAIRMVTMRYTTPQKKKKPEIIINKLHKINDCIYD